MPWQEVDTVSLRIEFVRLASAGGIGIAELCRRFAISRKTGYKWLERGRSGAEEALRDRSRRPGHSPMRTPAKVEARVVALRKRYPAWGPRKLHRVLANQGVAQLPTVSTVASILRRNGLIDPARTAEQRPFVRFEHPQANDLWQMDFLGDFAAGSGRCHTLTALDDHSRFNLVLSACSGHDTETVRQRLIDAFRHYGLPLRMTMDNGAPWGNSSDRHDLTPLVIWLMRLGIRVSHSRPFHPQTQGKDERFHRTLRAEVLSGRHFASIEQVQSCLNLWRPIYNGIRPHDSLGMQVPQERYQASPRTYPEQLPPLEYDSNDQIRIVQHKGWTQFRGQYFHLPQALRGQSVAFRATASDGLYKIYFGRHLITQINLNDPSEPKSNV